MPFPPNAYNEFTWVIGDPKIGEGTWIGPFCIIDGSGGLTIGEACDISSGTQIYTHSSMERCIRGAKIDERGQIDRDAIERKPVSIGDHTFIGPHVTILMGVHIGSRCVVGAGSVVTKSVPDNSIVVGVPATVVGAVTVSADNTVRLEYFDR
jgi:acetyltransferase-like isoleucine patch superfamily enzyme